MNPYYKLNSEMRGVQHQMALGKNNHKVSLLKRGESLRKKSFATGGLLKSYLIEGLCK